MGLTNWAEFAVFRGFKPDDWIFGTEFGLLHEGALPAFRRIRELVAAQLMSIRSPTSKPATTPSTTNSSSAPFTLITATEAILGYAYDFNKTWRAQVDFQSGSGNSSTIGFYLQHHAQSANESRTLRDERQPASTTRLRRLHLHVSPLGQAKTQEK